MLEIFFIIIGLTVFGWLIDKAMGSPKVEKPEPSEKEKRKNYIKSISTINPIKWAKYSKIIIDADKKFIHTYNFSIPIEYKTNELLVILANTLLFEEARSNELLPKDFIELLVGLKGNKLADYIKPSGNDNFDFELYEKMYSIYNDFRAREIRPIVSMQATFLNINRAVNSEDLLGMQEEYDKNPIFGRNI